MKFYQYLVLILIISCSTIFSAEDTIQLDQQLLTINDQKVTYDNYDSLLLPNGLSLPYQTIYIPMTNFDKNSQLSVINITKELITQFDPIDYTEIPTSSDPNLYTDVISSVAFDKLGSKQIQVIDKVTIDGYEYLKAMHFPLTIDSLGNAYFHSTSTFQFGENNVTTSSLLTLSQITGIESSKKSYQNKSLSTSAEYLIITNQALKESFEKLVAYKNETGITTIIKLIEDILPTQTGRDDAEKLREYLKEFYADGGQYLLLGGDETILPIRYTYHNLAFDTISLENQQVCDLYFADLTGNWNADNDMVWGEKYSDSADLTPELFVGRLPFNQPFEVNQYIEKLIQYETNQKQVDLSYLEKTFFFCSDQMRDYGTNGQHGLISEAFPDYFFIDTTNGVEFSSGNALNPTNPSSQELEPILSEGFGIINILAHGSSMTFEVRTSDYNEWPKSYFTTDTNLIGSGIISNLEDNNKISLYISLGCDNGAFDKDQPPFNHLNPNMAQTLLAQKNSGAVGFVANTRWGWVSTSHLLQKRFIEYLFANENQPAVLSLYQMKDDFYYYRDLIYGINYFGDPTMVIYTKKPESIELDISYQQSNVLITATIENAPIENSTILLSENSSVVATYTTDANGQALINYQFDLGASYKISASKDGFTINQTAYAPSIATDIDDENITLPTSFALEQNYPNPFNPSTTITFALPTKTQVKLQVFNMLGQEVKTLASGSYTAGIHQFEWDGKDNTGNTSATGIYLYRFETAEFVEVKKMILIK